MAATAYAASELVPARYRGWTDLVINGSFWIGAAIGGAALGLIVFVMRMWIPEARAG